MNLLANANVSIYWQLPILIVVISLVYSATRFDDWPQILREAGRWGSRMATFLLAIALILFVLAKWGVVPVLFLLGGLAVVAVVAFVLAK